MINNSHDVYRTTRQADKILLTLATKSLSPAVKALLTELLNAANKVVKMAHESTEGRAILKNRKTLNEDAFIPPSTLDQQSHVNAFDRLDREFHSLAADRPTRRRKAPKRYGHATTRRDESDTSSTEADADDAANDANYQEPSDSDHEEEADMLQKAGTKTFRQLKSLYWKLETDQLEMFNQDLLNLRLLLQLDPNRVYILEDLEDQDVLARALRLLYDSMFGIKKSDIRLSPHIVYDKLPASVADKMKERNVLAEEQLTQLADELPNISSK